MAVGSPWLAAAFGNPDAALYLAVLAPALVCDVSASIPQAMLAARPAVQGAVRAAPPPP